MLNTFYLFDLVCYSSRKFDSQLLRFLKGSREAAQIGQSLHADQSRSLFIRRLQACTKRWCFYSHWSTIKVMLPHWALKRAPPLRAKVNSPGSTWKWRISGSLSKHLCRLYQLQRRQQREKENCLLIFAQTTMMENISRCWLTKQEEKLIHLSY